MANSHPRNGAGRKMVAKILLKKAERSGSAFVSSMMLTYEMKGYFNDEEGIQLADKYCSWDVLRDYSKFVSPVVEEIMLEIDPFYRPYQRIPHWSRSSFCLLVDKVKMDAAKCLTKLRRLVVDHGYQGAVGTKGLWRYLMSEYNHGFTFGYRPIETFTFVAILHWLFMVDRSIQYDSPTQEFLCVELKCPKILDEKSRQILRLKNENFLLETMGDKLIIELHILLQTFAIGDQIPVREYRMGEIRRQLLEEMTERNALSQALQQLLPPADDELMEDEVEEEEEEEEREEEEESEEDEPLM